MAKQHDSPNHTADHARLRAVLETAVDGIITIDERGLIDAANPAAERLFGYTSEEMLGHNVNMLMPPPHQEEHNAYLANYVRTGKRKIMGVGREVEGLRKDGSTFPLYISVSEVLFGDSRVFTGFVHDLTDIRLAENELRIRDRAIQAANEGVVIADANQDGYPIVFVNEAYETLSGYPAEQAVGESCVLLCGSNPEEPVVSQLQNAFDEREECRMTIRCQRRNGEAFWNDISIAPVRSDSGAVTHIVAVMADVSEQRSAHEQLLQSERLAAIGQTVTGLAHESRNALQRAQACLDMLSLDLEQQPEQLELTEKARRALNDLHRHYEEVRNYSAPINLERRPTDLAKIWENTWRNLEDIRFRRDFQLVIADHDDLLICNVDDHRIGQVFRNIMENSVAACPDPGRLKIECRRAGRGDRETIRVTFRDNGPGFDSEAAANVFHPFFTTKQKGTGLGMAISKRIVEAHGGRIEILESSSGAVVQVELPR